MRYDLVQYGCDKCGKLTQPIEPTQKLPKGWVVVSRFTHLCPQCAELVKIEVTNDGHNKIVEK